MEYFVKWRFNVQVKVNRKIKKVVALLGIIFLCANLLPSKRYIVAQDTTEVTDNSQQQALTPKLINESTNEELNKQAANYYPVIYLNDSFGTGKNSSIGKDINFYSKNNVDLQNVPDAYRFSKVVVKSDEINGHSFTKEISKVIAVNGSYYGLIKGTTQDYLKFSNPSEQLMIVYTRYIKVGFKETSGSHFIKKDGTGIVSDLTALTPGGPNEEQLKNGFYINAQSAYTDQRLYVIPDFKSINFSREGITEISMKRGTAENAEALRSNVNFYQFTDNQKNTTFKENLNPYGYLSSKKTIDYNYFVKSSGVISLDNGIPATDGNKQFFNLHFPADIAALKATTIFNNYADAQKGIVNGMSTVSWAYATGRHVFPGDASKQENMIDGKLKLNDYPISKGGTVIFTISVSDVISNYSSYFTHLNKLVMNGQVLNLPIPQNRAKAGETIRQNYNKTAYTYLKSGELVAVSYVPLQDNFSGDATKPWNSNTGRPYYFVTVMNVQGNININEVGRSEGYSQGNSPIGSDITMIQDGHGVNYAGWPTRTIPVSYDGGGPSYEARDISTILSLDDDLDNTTLTITSGWENQGSISAWKFPHGYYVDGKEGNKISFDKSRRLIMDSRYLPTYQVYKASKNVNINSVGSDYIGRFYEGISQTGALKFENNAYTFKLNNNVSQGTYFYNQAITLYRIELLNKKFRTMSIQYQDLNGNVEQNKTVKNLVFPKSNVMLTSSFDIGDMGQVSSLEGNFTKIGTTENGKEVTKNDELGIITIPELPTNATYYELVSVKTNGNTIPLTKKKFLPGQKVFLGQFLPTGKDFGDNDGIDNGSVVTLKAVQVQPFSLSTEDSNAQKATPDMKVQTALEKWVNDTVTKDDLVTDEGAKSPTATFEIVNPQDMKQATTSPVNVYTLKNFADSSYEILPTALTVKNLPKAQLTVTNKQIVDPKTENADGSLQPSVVLATTSTAKSSILLTEKSTNYATVNQGSVSTLKIPLSEWLKKDGDNAQFTIGFTAVAKGYDPRGMSRTSNTTDTIPTTDSDSQEVTLTVTKADSPSMKVEAVSHRKEVKITFDKKPEDFSLQNTGGILSLTSPANDLQVTDTKVSATASEVTVILTLNRELKADETLQALYRYNARYKRASQTVTVAKSIEDIVVTGLNFWSQPFGIMILLAFFGFGSYGYFKRYKRKKN